SPSIPPVAAGSPGSTARRDTSATRAKRRPRKARSSSRPSPTTRSSSWNGSCPGTAAPGTDDEEASSIKHQALRSIQQIGTSMSREVPARSKNWRWGVCILLLLATTINYMDRLTLANTARRVKAEFELSNQQYGTIE